jgi:hypothetical protein
LIGDPSLVFISIVLVFGGGLMKWFLCACLTPALLPAALVSAAVVERDWKMPGDGLLTYDDVNRREWLDLSVSALNQFSAPRLENAVAEIAPGGLFDGFVWATRADVIGLAESAGITTSTFDFGLNELPTHNLIDLLSATPPFTVNILDSLGFIDESIGSPPFAKQVGADFFVRPSIGLIDEKAGLLISSSNDFLAYDAVGVLLYRSVPEPSSIILTLIASIIFWSRSIFNRTAASSRNK